MHSIFFICCLVRFKYEFISIQNVFKRIKTSSILSVYNISEMKIVYFHFTEHKMTYGQ